MTLIAVTQRTEYISEYNESRDSLDHRWHEIFSFCHITPLLIPNNLQITHKIIEQISFKGVLLTGGKESTARTDVENFLLEFAIQKKLPVLGVCHGMQVIQRFFGVPLYKVVGQVVEKQEILIHGKYEEVDSYHNIGTTETIFDLIVWAKASDGVVKAIQHRNMPIIGIMWHPERCYPFKKRDIQLIQKSFLYNLSGTQKTYLSE